VGGGRVWGMVSEAFVSVRSSEPYPERSDGGVGAEGGAWGYLGVFGVCTTPSTPNIVGHCNYKNK
jgi:hypothetical protein